MTHREEGRNLVSAVQGTNTYTYAYDSNGLRTSKVENGKTHTYLYASGKLLRETIAYTEDGEQVVEMLDFVYDHNGHPFALNYTVDGTSTRYYYITNLQGDVLTIITPNGQAAASYAYDPYGRVLEVTGPQKDTLGKINPLRYRGYYYDTETGFYYLLSRYFDADTSRFINADNISILGINGTVIGYNLFTYCENNPANLADTTGQFPVPTAANIIGSIVGLLGGAWIGLQIANHFGLTGFSKWACTASVSLLLGVVGYFAGQAVYVAIQSIVVKAISSGKIMLDHLQTWIQQALGISRIFAEKAAANVVNYFPKIKHIIGSPGKWSKFATDSYDQIRNWIYTALTNGTEFVVNSKDTYYIIYNIGEVIGTNGETKIKVVFDILGKIITSYPVK